MTDMENVTCRECKSVLQKFTSKTAKNPNRKFYSCKPCKFFVWEDQRSYNPQNFRKEACSRCGLKHSGKCTETLDVFGNKIPQNNDDKEEKEEETYEEIQDEEDDFVEKTEYKSSLCNETKVSKKVGVRMFTNKPCSKTHGMLCSGTSFEGEFNVHGFLHDEVKFKGGLVRKINYIESGLYFDDELILTHDQALTCVVKCDEITFTFR